MYKLLIGALALVAAITLAPACIEAQEKAGATAELITLPSPVTDKGQPLAKALALRRSVRSFTSAQLTLEQISQLLWAAQGVTDRRGYRTAPSAGALYPLEMYCVTGDGAFRYLPKEHALKAVSRKNLIRALADAALGQTCVSQSPCVFVFTGVYARTSGKYGERAERYVHIEVGHAAQNLMLQAVALGLGGVAVGAFRDERIAEVLGLPADHAPLLLVPVGVPR